jgi:hypothetical protein
MDSQRQGPEAPAACQTQRLAICWRLNRVVWIALEKLGERNKKRVFIAQGEDRTDDSDLLPSRSQRAFHQRNLAIGEGALDSFESAPVKVCESHHRTSCASWRSMPAFKILSAAEKMRCALRSGISAPASQF